MQPHDLPTPSAPPQPAPPPKKSNYGRYAMSLVLLVVVIGSVTWVVQYLPSRGPKKIELPTDDKKPLLAFSSVVANWGNKDGYPFKEFESGDKGFYDFLIKSANGQDVEVVQYSSDCDCTSVQACAIEGDELQRLDKMQREKPGEPLEYTQKPDWQNLPNAKTPQTPARVLVKGNGGGVVRVLWATRKSPGLELRISPHI